MLFLLSIFISFAPETANYELDIGKIPTPKLNDTGESVDSIVKSSFSRPFDWQIASALNQTFDCDPINRRSCKEGKVCAEIFVDSESEFGLRGKCVVPVNECWDPRLNDCDQNAHCIDNDFSYECLCPEGFIDTSPTPSKLPGRKCQKLLNECESPQLSDCDKNAECTDKPVGYACQCKAGFKDVFSEDSKQPGRRCIKAKSGTKCTDGLHDCNINAECIDLEKVSTDAICRSNQCDPVTSQCVITESGPTCQCRKGFVENGGNTSQRKCVRTPGSNPCQDYTLHDCDSVAECDSEHPGQFQCKCPSGYVDISPDKLKNPGRKCKKAENECALGIHKCDANAECVDTAEGYACRCKSGWVDVSADRVNLPGRSCRRNDQCHQSDCSSEAECREGPNGAICQCHSGFVDVSVKHGRLPGRVCKIVANECANGKHDCSTHATCIDTADAFTCRCKDGFRDESANPNDRPGRTCVRTHVPQTPECNVNDPMTCDKQKHEVCLFRDGNYVCACPNSYSRLPDGRCLVINECEDARLNDCSADAECIDQAEGYLCQCRQEFADVSPQDKTGVLCRRRVNECAQPKNFSVDCDSNAVCVDTDDGFLCRCRPGFADISESFNKLAGRRCIEAVNECLDAKMNDCSDNAICEDAKEGYACKCLPGFVDASANSGKYPGRVCNKPTERIFTNDTLFSIDLCDPNIPEFCKEDKVCTDRFQAGTFVCDCPDGSFLFDDGSCRQSAACKKADCDRNAYCINIFDSFRCQCRPGYFDISPDSEVNPGRVCKELVNECSTEAHDCSSFAECIDASDGYACVCIDGFVDTSHQLGMLPGRKCSNASNECADRSLNTCDENADCIDFPQGYSCQCFEGYIDVSPNAHLPPGRVCTVQTTCPKQKTDLIFLIDGSGSIGSLVFKNEVLRFVRDFLELFDVGAENTRVGLIQYSDQIRHEFDLNQHVDKQTLLQAIAQTQYLTGLTRTGAAIQHMVLEGFSERRGARPLSSDVSRVAIVITDGRSQDNVTEPAKASRELKVNMFSIGVTDHVLAAELESIAGSPTRWFYVDRFRDLNMRLRSIIQKIACPTPHEAPRLQASCNPDAQTGCDRSRNEVCESGKQPRCQCSKDFPMHPLSRVCGGQLCNPDVLTSCAHPEVCRSTIFGNFRCVCPADHARDQRTGICLPTKEAPPPHPECIAGLMLNPRSGKCIIPGSCDPEDSLPCDIRKRERCILHPSGRYHTCSCVSGEKRHPVTEICMKNECLRKEDNDCAPEAKCVDTDDGDGYICWCPAGYFDQSVDPANRPGRVCISAQTDECAIGTHHCSPDAVCTDTPESYVCRCKPGFVDISPNLRHESGVVCKRVINECGSSQLNTCHKDAICHDTDDAYTCICKPGFTDLDELRNPGRKCVKIEQNDMCFAKKHDCDKNARCISRGVNDHSCICLPNFKDKSPDAMRKPGRVCIPMIPECDNPSLNDCDSPDRAICIDTDEGYQCQCRQGFFDISPDQSRSGRLCKLLENECKLNTHDCARDGGICDDTLDSYVCRCAVNYLDVSFDKVNRPGRKCKRLIDECSSGQNDCSSHAKCTDTEDSYICACFANFLDVSLDAANRPGRRCLPRVNECLDSKLHDCSPNANCVDTAEGYACQCADDFMDESPDSRRPGRVCRPKLVDECRTEQHNCHPEAECIDMPQGFTCQCREQFFDESPNRVLNPGRMCSPRAAPPSQECSLTGQGCKKELNEICRVIGGSPKCSCPINYSRNAQTRACTVIDECRLPQLNDCHPGAECTDKLDGYTCKCKQGFKDLSLKEQPGRNCHQLVDECQFSHLNDCHQNAQCIDLDDGYQCRCNAGFKDLQPEQPGRLCKQTMNECARPDLNSCDKNAKCIDLEDGYRCECSKNFLDTSPSPTLSGRACRPLVNECSSNKLNDCDKQARCIDTPESYMCECPANAKDISPNLAAFPGRVCHIFENECLTGKHDCDPAGVCHDNEHSFTCECPDGYTDRSPNKTTRPGRVCVELIDECRESRHTCSPQAECRDLEDGYTCECRDGYVDRSPNMAVQPGRVCGPPETCPSNHDCSSAAICEPLGGNKFHCACIQGYEDQSPAGTLGRICTRIRNCADQRLNNCSRNAICYDDHFGGGSYRCECRRGFIDRSPDARFKGRICELPPPLPPQPRHPCQGENECHQFAVCRATGAQNYTCECVAGHVDRSIDLKSKPGRVCVQQEPVCLDSSLNDCHSDAICMETNSSDGYNCKCRDGYIDKSADKIVKPGRICDPLVNECMDRSLNDCDPKAICEDLPEGYTCRCPISSMDQSPEKEHRPGRKCLISINECASQSLHNCSRFADCIDKPAGYDCKCRQGYHDMDPKNAGTSCHLIINECLSKNMNDCSGNADCIDLLGGYTCKCKSPFVDSGPANQPGRLCKYDECKDPKLNDCSEFAVCEDTEESFVCRCKDGFYDESGIKGKQPGRMCMAFSNDSVPPIFVKPERDQINGIACGLNNFCLNKLNEVCIGGTRCICRPGEGRTKPGDICSPIDRIPLAFRVVSRGKDTLFYNSEFGTNTNPAFVDFASEFQKDVGKAISITSYATRYVTTDVSYITHPRTVNSSWPDGLLVNFTVGTIPNAKSPVDLCDLWQKLMASLRQTNGAIGGGRIQVASDVELLNPCIEYKQGEPCGGALCSLDLGEVCIAGTLCGCASGQKRARAKDVCRSVESWTIPLWVARKHQHNLVFNESFANPQNEVNKAYVVAFEKGVAECYPHTTLKNAFVTAEVNDIISPASINASLDTGILFNCSMYFRKGSVHVPSDSFYALIRYIVDKNNYQIGSSGLYINPYQPNPFGPCYKNECNPRGICIEVGPKDYRCECSPGYRDLKPESPGRECVPTKNFNECEDSRYNICSNNSRCIDLEYLYKCECMPGFSDSSPKGSIPGSVCNLDYCNDVNYCSSNSTCVNLEEEGICQCKHGFTDIRESPEAIRTSLGLRADQYCLTVRDIDECVFGINNCSKIAECIDLEVGYTCRCPVGYLDGQPETPGRVCAALLCDLCNKHGDCVHDVITNNVTCSCTEGYTGEFCEVAPSVAPLVLLVVLALFFLLLTCCCLLWLCTKLHCFERRHPWATLDQSSSSESGGTSLYGGIPRAKLKTSEQMSESPRHLAHCLDDYLRIPRAHLHADERDLASLDSASSEYTIREEIERRVVTDITRTEVVTTEADVHEEECAEASNKANKSKSNGARTQFYASQSGRNNETASADLSDELDRGESIVEFANSREWNQHQRSPDFHNAGYIPDLLSATMSGSSKEKQGVAGSGSYAKTVQVNRNHEYDPSSGTERFRREVKTVKTSDETLHR